MLRAVLGALKGSKRRNCLPLVAQPASVATPLTLCCISQHLAPRLLMQGVASGSIAGFQLSIDRQAAHIKEAHSGFKALEVHDALSRVYNTEDGSPEREEAVEAYLSMLPEKPNGRRSTLQPGAELLPAGSRQRMIPGLRVLASILGIDATCARRARDIRRKEIKSRGLRAVPGRRLGTHVEKQLVAQYVTAMARQRHAQGRPEIARLLRDLLLLRQTASTNEPAIHALNAKEKRFVEGDSSLSQSWFMRWEEIYQVGHLTKAALQSEKRAASFTMSTAARHIRQLDDKLL